MIIATRLMLGTTLAPNLQEVAGGQDEYHEGRPELIVWNFSATDDNDGFPTFWGNSSDLDDAKELKTKYEEEFHYNQEAFANFNSNSFRWTCCGATLDNSIPCDHHGRGSSRCTCDFCIRGAAVSAEY